MSDGQQVATILGQTVTVSISNDSVFINDAYVSRVDIETDNGVVHVIEADMILWDLNGKQMRLQRLSRGQHNINVSNLMQRMYFLEFRIGNERVQQPIIIKR